MALPRVSPQWSSGRPLQVALVPLEGTGEAWLLAGWGGITVFLVLLIAALFLGIGNVD